MMRLLLCTLASALMVSGAAQALSLPVVSGSTSISFNQTTLSASEVSIGLVIPNAMPGGDLEADACQLPDQMTDTCVQIRIPINSPLADPPTHFSYVLDSTSIDDLEGTIEHDGGVTLGTGGSAIALADFSFVFDAKRSDETRSGWVLEISPMGDRSVAFEIATDPIVVAATTEGVTIEGRLLVSAELSLLLDGLAGEELGLELVDVGAIQIQGLTLPEIAQSTVIDFSSIDTLPGITIDEIQTLGNYAVDMTSPTPLLIMPVTGFAGDVLRHDGGGFVFVDDGLNEVEMAAFAVRIALADVMAEIDSVPGEVATIGPVEFDTAPLSWGSAATAAFNTTFGGSITENDPFGEILLPEPSSALMGAVALAGVALLARRRVA